MTIKLKDQEPSKLKPIIEAAEDAAVAARKIITSEGFNDRSTWKFDCKNDDVTVHYKDIEGRRFFAAQTVVPLTPSLGLSLNWEHVGSMAEWNENIQFSKIVGKIRDDLDLTHYASNEVMMVKSREFVVARKLVEVEGASVVAAASCETDLVSEAKGSIRALLHLGFGRYVPEPANLKQSRYDYVVSMDLKGMMPTYLVNQVLGKMVMSDVENHRRNAIEYSKTTSE